MHMSFNFFKRFLSSESLQVVDYQFVNLIADKNKLVVEMRVSYFVNLFSSFSLFK